MIIQQFDETHFPPHPQGSEMPCAPADIPFHTFFPEGLDSALLLDGAEEAKNRILAPSVEKGTWCGVSGHACIGTALAEIESYSEMLRMYDKAQEKYAMAYQNWRALCRLSAGFSALMFSAPVPPSPIEINNTTHTMVHALGIDYLVEGIQALVRKGLVVIKPASLIENGKECPTIMFYPTTALVSELQ